MSIAASTGECCQLEVGSGGLAASTANEVTWLVREGSAFVQRFKVDDAFRIFIIEPQERGLKDGDVVLVKSGVIVSVNGVAK
jgi:hypothetical protein